MKPVLLEMTAFGPYVEPTTVDFQKLNNSLYLITGDTGAGKTTIFDGIMVALYGVPSGKGDHKSRTFEMLHCDYVEKSVDTKVSLTFEHIGKRYRVERRLHFRKKRDTGAYEKATPQAYLWEPDKDVLEKTEPVTRRITQLLGMNAEQFRKIAMLAQGEFKKFLDADSEEKNKILGELFDNSAYVYFQELFAAAKKKLEQDRKEKGTDRIKRAMDDFMCPEEAGDEEKAVYSAAEPHLESALYELVDLDREKWETLKRIEQTGREQDRELYEKKGRAKEQNRQLAELEEKEKEQGELLKKKESVERLKEQAGRVEKAFYKVKPMEEAAEKTKEDYENALKSIEKTRERLRELEEERKKREQAWKACEQEAKPVIDRLARAIGSLEESLPLYEELEKTRREQKREQELAGKAKEKKLLAEQKQNRIMEELTACKEGIKGLEGVDVEKERLYGELKKAGEDLDKLISPDGIVAQAEAIHRQEKELLKEQKKLQKINGQAGEMSARYNSLYQAFLEGQAGILARKLEEELEEKKEAACPVCRTVFRGAHMGRFAGQAEKIPEKAQVDKARQALDNKEKERQELSQIIVKLETSIREKKTGVAGRLQELEKGTQTADWETICADGYLEERQVYYGQVKEKAETAYRQAYEQSRKLEDLRKQAAKREEEEAACREELEKNADSEREHKQALEKLKAVEEERIKSLAFYAECPDEGSARNKKKAWEEEREKRQQELEQAQTLYHKADRQCEEIKGALESGLATLPKLEREMSAAAGKHQAALTENGFQDASEIYGVLEPTGDSDAATESWILKKREEITAFENRLKNTGERVSELKEKTKGLKETDLEKLDLEIQKQGEALSEIQRQLELCTKQYDNHKKTVQIVAEANRTLADTQSAWERLSSLADLANGANAAGGKLSFDRYVMGYVFREILEMANRRLTVMSGGRYELQHEIQAGRENAAAGLEVSVLDMTTGKCRPAQSLSGGESFFVSLALALGLSDAVSNHAGGKRLDSLFIDEGFGSLDNDVLDKALSVLNQLTQGNRLVGIISHVARLNESIPQQICVKNSEKGSTLTVVC